MHIRHIIYSSLAEQGNSTSLHLSFRQKSFAITVALSIPYSPLLEATQSFLLRYPVLNLSFEPSTQLISPVRV